MYADAAAQARMSARSVREDFPARDRPSASRVNTIISRSSSSASMMLAAWWCRTVNTYCRCASKLTYSAPPPIATSSHAAAAISTEPGARPPPASRRTLVTCRVPSQGPGR